MSAAADHKPGECGPAAEHPSDVLKAVLTRLHAAGYWLLPLGAGEDGRKPSLSFSTSDGRPTGRHPLELTIRRMAAVGTSNYAIRLMNLLVVDVDTDTQEAHAYVERWFGSSSVQIKTGKGIHHWYRFKGQKPPPIRRPNILIDFKAGVQDLAAGPFAERADGVRYLPQSGRLETIDDLPEFVDRRPTPNFNEETRHHGAKVATGCRNKALYGRAIEDVLFVDDLQELVDNLLQYRTIEFEEPMTVPDEEVRSVANWAWQKRLENNVWGGRNFTVKIPRRVGQRLVVLHHGANALALLFVLLDKHGHIPGKRFAIVPDAMRAAGLLKLCRNHVYAARDLLVAEGMLIKHPPVKPGKPCQYQLTVTMTGGGHQAPISAEPSIGLGMVL